MQKVEKKVIITIKSLKYNCEEIRDADKIPFAALSTLKATDHIEIDTEGLLRVIGQRISVVYNEDETSGMEGTRSVISYHTSDKESVKIMRSGTVRSSFDVKAGLTDNSNYVTSFFNFNMNVTGFAVINKLCETGGELFLDYLLEIPYSIKERTLMTINVKIKEEEYPEF